MDPQSVATGDLNGDGALDLVVATASDDRIAVLLNTTDVVPPATLAMVSPAANATAGTRPPLESRWLRRIRRAVPE